MVCVRYIQRAESCAGVAAQNSSTTPLLPSAVPNLSTHTHTTNNGKINGGCLFAISKFVRVQEKKTHGNKYRMYVTVYNCNTHPGKKCRAGFLRNQCGTTNDTVAPSGGCRPDLSVDVSRSAFRLPVVEKKNRHTNLIPRGCAIIPRHIR